MMLLRLLLLLALSVPALAQNAAPVIPLTAGVPVSSTNPFPTTSTDYITEPAGTAAPLLLGVQGGGAGSLPISQPDAGNRADGNGTGTCAATCVNTALVSMDTSSFGGGQTSLHVTAFSGSATIVPQDSDDNVNFVTAAHCWQSNAGDLTIAAVTAAGTYVCNIEKRFFRWQYTVYGSGTQTAFWDNRYGPYFPAPSITGAAGTALVAVLAAKASAGNLIGFNCTAVAGAAAGFCLGYNATACPTNGSAVTAAAVLDVCTFDTSNKGCSLSRNGGPSKRYGTGISICMTTATSPFGAMVSNVNTGYISADFQ